MTFVFSSESVGEGHPDKVCDQISDAILDACLTQDPDSRVAAETFATNDMVALGGEITTKASVDYEQIARNTILEIGYDNEAYGLNGNTCNINTYYNEQSADIAQGVNENQGLHKEAGAGDQGMMFGYACKQSESLMPLPIKLSHDLMVALSDLRHSGTISYLLPDAKSQVSIEYADRNTPKRIHTVVVSTQHQSDVSLDQIKTDITKQLINAVLPAHLLDSNTRIFVNPTGRFVTGGPLGDAGLTGRKIIVDTYGGWASHGGGAFSGKDATKVDRSAAYMARYVAKNLVAADIAEEIQVQLAYAIGVAEPVSICVDTFGTGRLSDGEIETLIKSVFNLTPSGIIETLDLKRPIYRNTARFGHFGRDDLSLSWENCNKVDTLKSKANLNATVF